MTRNASGIKRVKSNAKPKLDLNTGYHFNTQCPKTSEEITTHIHGKLKVKRNSNGKVEKVSLTSRGRD